MKISEQVGTGVSIVDFYTDWCVPCRFVSESLGKIKEKFGNKLNLVKINAEEHPELANEFNIASVPSLFFFKNGELKDSIFGNVPQTKIEEMLNKLIV